jgi:hypothetical protein
MKLPISQLTLAVGTISMVEPSTVHSLVPLNTGLIRSSGTDVNVTSLSAAFSPAESANIGSAADGANNDILNGLSSLTPIRITGTPSE